jgi:exopolyphosphatase/pppGpp-phosphohydrolase
MPVFHSKDELLGVLNSLSDRALADGVLIDLPRTRRREQGTNPQKQLRLNIDADLKKRMAAQINRYVEKYGKQLGWDILIQRLEKRFEDEPSDAT